MSDKQRKRWSIYSTLWVVIVLLVLYVPSVGPVFWLYRMTGLGQGHPIAKILVIIYEPVRYLMFSDVTRPWIESYLSVWSRL